ncbi:MAG: cytochrome c oxidase subunit 3 [Chlamydiae bacterium]|nr:cytochrome c oxidase subunit 3 [Chlamydiota bacterium]
MKHAEISAEEGYADTHHDLYSKTVFGFWVYLVTDFVLFGTFFATFAVLHNNTYGGPGAAQLFKLPFALIQTLLLLTAAFLSGLGGAAAHRKNKGATIAFFALTMVLGIIFMGMELNEFSRLIKAGHGWEKSAFLSIFFTLVGTHGLHVLFAILWVIALLIPVIKDGITAESLRRLTCLRMFWQFLNIVWVFIFTFVYFMGDY